MKKRRKHRTESTEKLRKILLCEKITNKLLIKSSKRKLGLKNGHCVCKNRFYDQLLTVNSILKNNLNFFQVYQLWTHLFWHKMSAHVSKNIFFCEKMNFFICTLTIDPSLSKVSSGIWLLLPENCETLRNQKSLYCINECLVYGH